MATPDIESKDSVNDLSWLKLGYYTWYKLPEDKVEFFNNEVGLFRFASKRLGRLLYYQWKKDKAGWFKCIEWPLNDVENINKLKKMIDSRGIIKISKQEVAKIILTKKGIAQPCKLKHRPF